MKTIHPLEAYYKNKGMTAGEMAREVGCSGAFISQVIHFKKRPSPELAAKIEKLTQGKVKFRELLLPFE